MKKLGAIIPLFLLSLSVFSQWQWQNPLPTGNYLYSFYFTNVDTGYTVGQNGTVLKTTNCGEVGINEYTSGFYLLKIYPNPSLEKITVKKSEIMHQSLLTLINLNGQEIIRCQITEPTTTIDVSTLPGGV